MSAGEIKAWRCIDILPNVAGDIPAYDLGYLLWKLQEHPRVELRQLSGRRWLAERTWGSVNPDDAVTRHFIGEVGDTPEDAAANLAIELFKQGVLTRDGDE